MSGRWPGPKLPPDEARPAELTGGAEEDRAYAEIDLGCLRHNLREIERRSPAGCRVMAVVKADAYGHGAVRIAAALQRWGVDSFAVAELGEAIELRRGGIRGEILILGYTPVGRKRELMRYRLTQTIVDEAYAQALCATDGVVRAHVKLDTGMRRLGVPAEDGDALQRVYRLPGLRIAGTYSHLARADSRSEQDLAFTREQIRRFADAIGRLRARGVDVGRTHLQSSYGLLHDMGGVRCDYVRPGIALYGLLSRGGEPAGERLALRPVLSLRARVASVKRVRAGESVGYGRTYTASRDMTMAAVSFGYADGYPRQLTGSGVCAAIRGRRVPVIGSVCMDQLMLDVTDAGPVAAGDVVTLIGRDGEAVVRADELSLAAGTINNELLSRIGPRVARRYSSPVSLLP